MNSIFDLSNRRFLITGASSGIGRAAAIQLSRLGANVICCGRDIQRLQQTMGCLADGDHHSYAFDLAAIDQVSDWVQETVQEVGKLNGFVHAAGLQSSVPVFRIKSAQWSRMRDANLDCFIELIRAFQKPAVYAGEHGRVIALSTVLVKRGSAGRSAYAASKGAIEGMIPSLAVELASRAICVNAVAPSFVRTPMYDEVARFWSEEQAAAVERQHPLGIGNPEDVAAAIAFLAAPAGRWVTGTVLRVDGGYGVA